jgi:tetratricopeptide (TPR) repeat protein
MRGLVAPCEHDGDGRAAHVVIIDRIACYAHPVTTDWQQAFERGMQAGGAGDLAAAERAFRDAAALAPDEPYPHYELGYTLALLGRFADAVPELRRTQELQRGFFLVETELYLCDQVLAGAIDRDTLVALRKLIAFTDRSESTTLAAEQLARAVVTRAPACALGHFFLGKAILERLPDQARTALERCVELGADDTTAINARFHLGVLRNRAGALDEARAIWRRIASDFAGHPHAKLAAMSAG